MIGVWASASRRKSPVRDDQGDVEDVGPWVQVSRLGNPLFNEVVVPMAKKDYWNALPPADDDQFLKYVQQPELAKLLPVLYPGVFPNLAGLTGRPCGPGGDPADRNPERAHLRVPELHRVRLRGHAAAEHGHPAGLGPEHLRDPGRRPGRVPERARVQDDVVAIELRAIAGVTYPLVDPSYTPDEAAGLVTDGTTPDDNPIPFLDEFPYLGVPLSGYDVVPPNVA